MKRLLLILGSYLLICFGICLGAAFILKGIPELLPRDVVPYKIQRGIRVFLDILPAICLSGFTVAGTISFAKDSDKCITKFSPAMVSNFKSVMICALIVVALLTTAKELFNPILQRQKTRYIETPALLNEYIEMGEEDFQQEKMLLAYGYAKQALKIDPQDERAKQLLDKAQGAIEGMSALETVIQQPKSNDILKKPATSEDPASTFQLIRMAMSAYEKKNYFDAHYYADMAIKSATEKNINYETAKIIRSNAWNQLCEPSTIQDTAANKFYREKQEAYKLLMNGNNLEAYYKFLELSKDTRRGKKDPDISRYLAIAKERLDEMYFFIEETEDLHRFESAENVYFSVKLDEERRSVFYIRGVTSVNETGGMVQYLRGFQVNNYGKDGELVYSMSVPYAKMLVLNTENLDEATKEKFHLEKMKEVPYLMLESVSRTTNLDVIRPDFVMAVGVESSGAAIGGGRGSYEERVERAKLDFGVSKSFMIIPMPCSDFNRICEASFGISKMDLISLYGLSKVSEKYGLSQEVYTSTLVSRCSYPIEIMILMIFFAIMAWGYRLKDGQVFKFKYIFVLPAASIVFYFALKFADYIFRFLTFAVVCYCGEISLAIAILFWIIVLITLSINFMSHKN